MPHEPLCRLSGCIPHEFAELTETLADICNVDFSNNPDMLWPVLKSGRWQWERREDDRAFFKAEKFKAIVKDTLQAAAGGGTTPAAAASSTALQEGCLPSRPKRR